MIAINEKTVCFTGHRKIPPEQRKSITGRLEKVLIQLIEQGYRYFGAGGALGFDTITATAVLHQKERYPQIKLILVVPCKTQTRGWDKADKKLYEDIKAKCDKSVYTSEEYTKSCMFKRNRCLVDNSSVCVCYLTENKGGTAYTVNYARQKDLKIINIGEKN